MNKRIQELLVKAEVETKEHFSHDWDGTPREEYDLYFHKKFAELIVQDCLNVLCEEMDKLGIDLSNLAKWYKAMENTENYFGIK